MEVRGPWRELAAQAFPEERPLGRAWTLLGQGSRLCRGGDGTGTLGTRAHVSSGLTTVASIPVPWHCRPGAFPSAPGS